MKRLIEQMPVLSESETKREEKWETVNFSDIAEQNAPVTESVAYEKNIGYMADICPEVFVCGSADSVRRIVASLVDNAIKYEKEGGNVAVELKNEKKKAVFSVRNKTSVIKVIHLVDALTDGAQIGVTCAVAPTAGNPVVITSGYSEFCTENPSEFFFSNNDNYEICWNSSRTEAALYLKSDPPTKFGVTINGLSETVTLTNYDYDGTIIVAFYKSNGALVDLKTYQPQAIINAELPNEADSYAYTTVFWWESLDTLHPLCDAVTINN